MTDVFSYGNGGCRLRLLAANGTTEVTLMLPAMSNGGLTHSFDESKIIDEMLDHSLSVTINGYYHRFKCRWDIYDHTTTGYTVGILDNNTPTVLQLEQVLTSYRPGRIQFSPSYIASFYTVYLDKLPVVTPISDTATSYEFEVKTINIYETADNTPSKELA